MPKEKKIMPVFYLPPIVWFGYFLEENNEIILEQYENFPKQTYRNRCEIYGANGKLTLSIPISHKGRKPIKDIEISYAENWQLLHWKSIKNAYQASPYFEYYEETLSKIYAQKQTFLMDFNINALSIIQEILKTEKQYLLSSKYQKISEERKDFRDFFSAKRASDFPQKHYQQTFSDKYGFIKNLSIIDLLCNIGPESATYFK